MPPLLNWPEGSVFIVGGGPSAKALDLERLRGRGIVVAVNDSAKLLPWADVIFTADMSWLMRRRDFLQANRRRCIAAAPSDFKRPRWARGIEFIERREGADLSSDPGAIHFADNSGFGALALAIARGARRIVLIGFDMDGPGHWHAGYEWKCRKGVRDYPRWTRAFEVLAKRLAGTGIEVLNANFASKIRCFPFIRLDECAPGVKVDVFKRVLKGRRKGKPRCAIVTAHPDDETLWCGGLMARYRVGWTVICCSIPRRDPVRAWKFFDACAALGATGRLLPYVEPEPTRQLAHLEQMDLSGFDLVVTHNAAGEYGHVHHRQVHAHVMRQCPEKTVLIGYGLPHDGQHVLELTEDERAAKLAALGRYDHVLAYEGKQMPKHEALIQRYGKVENFDLFRESYHVASS